MSDSPTPSNGASGDDHDDLLQALTESIGEVAAGLASTIRANPALATALIAIGIGALIGVSFARRPRSRRERLMEELEEQVSRVRRPGKRLSAAADYGGLLPMALKLLENPVVRGFLIRTVTKSFARRFR